MTQITVRKSTWEALKDFNERETGHGIDAKVTKFWTTPEGEWASFNVTKDTLLRLRNLSSNMDEAILMALNGGKTIQ